MKPKTVGSLLDLVNYSQDDFHIIVPERGYTIAENRSHSVIQAMKNGSDYLFFVDDDMIFPKDTLEKLMVHTKEVVGVNSPKKELVEIVGTNYTVRGSIGNTTVGLLDKDGGYKDPGKYPGFEMELPKELFKAYFVGTGVMLIDMKVFEKLEKPYFKHEMNDEGLVICGEDGYFCKKVRQAGIDVWCDPTIKIGHIGDYEY